MVINRGEFIRLRQLAILVVLGLSLLYTCSSLQPARAQSTEVQQLLLNVEKLAQLRNILSDMEKGYTALVSGYNAVRNVAQGNFSLHKAFLDGLMAVSPTVRNYRRVGEIIVHQQTLLSEYRNAYQHFRQAGTFRPRDLEYIKNVYDRLIGESGSHLDELVMITTAAQLRMNDQERLNAIDRIFHGMQSKLIFLRDFNASLESLNRLRTAEQHDYGTLNNMF